MHAVQFFVSNRNIGKPSLVLFVVRDSRGLEPFGKGKGHEENSHPNCGCFKTSLELPNQLSIIEKNMCANILRRYIPFLHGMLAFRLLWKQHETG